MKIKTLINGVFTIAVILVLVVIGLSYFNLPIPSKIRLFTVASQSMRPTLQKGDLIVTKQQTSYKKGDIITFVNPRGRKKIDTVTHRIIKIEKERQETIYITKGDANNVADGWKIKKSDVLGLFVFKVPLIGGLISLSKTPAGFVLLVIIPATIIIYSELMSIKREVGKIFAKKKAENKNEK